MGFPLRVLIVEDSPDDEKLVLRQLHKAGYEVESMRVDTGEAMRRALDVREWDVVISDFNMPLFNGLEAIKVARESGSSAPFILVSGTVGEEVAVEAIRAGASDYLMKDRLVRLVPAVERALRENRTVRERKMAEDALRESEEIFRHFMENSPIFIFFKDENIRTIRVSRNFEKMVGRPIEEIIGKTMDELFPSDMAKTMIELDKEILREGKIVSVEEKLGDRFYETVKFPINIDGKPRYLAGYTVDVTDARLADEAVQRRIRWTEALIDLFQFETEGEDAIVSHALDLLVELTESELGFIGFVNDSESQMSGYVWSANAMKECAVAGEKPVSFDVVKGGLWTAAIKEKKAIIVNDYTESHPQKNGIPAGHIQIKRFFGVPLLREDKAVLVTGLANKSAEYTDKNMEDVALFLEALWGVISRKRAERQSREHSRHIEAMFDQATAGIAMVGLDGRWIRVNRRLCQIVGYAEEDLLKMRFREITHPDDVQADIEAIEKMRSGEMSSYTREKRYICKDGNIVWVHISVGIVRDTKGNPEYVTTVIEDISERKISEEKRKELEVQLQQAQKMEAVGRLAGGVAHDFNNTLTVIQGYTEMLVSDTAPDNPVQARLSAIRKASEQAAGLTRQLLAFSRRQVLQPQVMDLNRAVGDMRTMLGRLIGEDVVVRTQLGEGLWSVLADPGQVNQVLMNLAVNARDAMPEGGTLTVETANVELDQAYADGHQPTKPGAYVCVKVSDTGIGMDAETRARIFEPFFTTKEQGKGTGLGLSTVYGIVKQSNGFIWVNSEPGKGTTFEIYLPRVAGDAVTEHKKSTPTSKSAGKETILVVEDQEEVRAVVCLKLRSIGYRILEAHDGPSAIALIGSHPEAIDLLVTDMVMPGLGGQDLAVILKEKRPAMHILFMSGHTEKATFQTSILGKGEFFIQKPFALGDLAAKVREALDS